MTHTTKRTVLIVDDDPDILEQLEIYLSRMELAVISADSQSEAEQVIAGGQSFDLAVLDLMMEHDDSGFILSHRIKKMNPDIPVILLTAVAGETGIKFDALTGSERSWIKADCVMDKDIRYEQLKGSINRLLENK